MASEAIGESTSGGSQRSAGFFLSVDLVDDELVACDCVAKKNSVKIRTEAHAAQTCEFLLEFRVKMRRLGSPFLTSELAARVP